MSLLWGMAVAPLVLALTVHATGRRRRELPARPCPAVVLGALVRPDGRPSQALQDRVRVGVALLESGGASRLVLSGGSPDGRPTEASVMQDLALRWGARTEALTLESNSRSTRENAQRCAEVLASSGEEDVLLVTCDFHVARAVAHFRAVGLRVSPVPSLRDLSLRDRLRVTVRETCALLLRPWLLWHLWRPGQARTFRKNA